MRYGEKIDENPSPGNKAGGITTLEDKSLGCIQKSGSAPVEDVLSYGERARRARGLSLLEAPGNDLVASCALAASGAQLVLFTTGRGTPFASPVPTLKISSNSDLAARKNCWIDFDAGRMLSEGTEPSSLSRELLRGTCAFRCLRKREGQKRKPREKRICHFQKRDHIVEYVGLR